MSALTERIRVLLPNAKLHKEDADSDDVIVWGPPGTGKTTSLMTLLDAHLTAEHDPRQIMVATFTRNAKRELASRLSTKFGLTDEETPWLRTIHSTAYRLLELEPDNVMGPESLATFGRESGYHFEGILVKRTVEDPFGTTSIQTFGDWCHTAEELRRAKLMSHAEAVREFIPPDAGAGWTQAAAERYSAEYRMFKQEHGLLDFTDMLEKVLENSLFPPVITMFVDEAQDLTPLQWAVIDLWRRHARRLFIFGDDDQSIYQFAGASPDLLWKRAGSQFVLSHSYRLRSKVHAEANKIIARTRQRVTKDFEPHEEGGSIHELWSWYDVNLEREGTYLVIARNRAYLDEARAALLYRALPFKDRTSPAGVPDWHSARGRAIKTVLDLHAGRVIAGRGRMRTLYNETVNKRYWPEDKVTRGSASWAAHDLLDAGATPEMVKAIMEDPLTVLKMTEADRDYLRSVWKARGEAGLTEAPKIELSTIHGVKGEEADHVVVSTAMTRRTYDDFVTNPDSEHRVFYVAATRAKQSLTWLMGGKGYPP
jgi:DNA helicase II / ATP-dependent DNA helicase PcrA